MHDFTSALYLGFRHPHRLLPSWESLTLGKPATLEESALQASVAQELALLQGCERGVLAPSTLHLFWDLFGILSRQQVAIYMDAGVYPIARWGGSGQLDGGRRYGHSGITTPAACTA